MYQFLVIHGKVSFPSVFIVLLLLFHVQTQEFFFSSPSQNINLGNTNATTFQIADDQSMVVVGYNNGMVQAFTMDGLPLRNFTGFSVGIENIWWIQQIGPLVMDVNGNIKVYQSENGNILDAIQVSKNNLGSITDITYLNNNSYIGFAYTFVSGQTIQSMVVEYVFNGNNLNFEQNKVYNLPILNYPYFFFYNVVQYSENYQILFVMNVNNEMIYQFNCSTGQQIMVKSMPGFNPGESVTPGGIFSYGDSYLMVQNQLQNNVVTPYLYSFNGNDMNFQYIVSYTFGSAQGICQQNLYFVLGSTSQPIFNVYSTFDSFLQQLTSPNGISTMVECSSNYMVSLTSSNYLSFYQYVPAPSSSIISSIVFKFGSVEIIIVIIIDVIFFIGIIVFIFYLICKKKKQNLLLNKSHDNKQESKKVQNFIKTFKYVSIKVWQYGYLIIFTLANVLDLVWSSSIGNIAHAFIPLILVCIALLIKLILLCGRITFRQFINMQLQFISPYVLTVINVVLVVQIGVSFNYNAQSIQYFDDFKPNLSFYFLLQGIQYLIVSVICSLVMNRKSNSKTQFYFLLLNITLQAAGSLVMTIFYIKNINQASDSLKDGVNSAMQNLVGGSLTEIQYEAIYKALTLNISAFETAKDYALASLASIIAVLIILIDMIGRPFEKQEQKQDIFEEFINESKKSKNEGGSKQQIQSNNEKKQETQLCSVPEKGYKNLEINQSDRRSSRQSRK